MQRGIFQFKNRTSCSQEFSKTQYLDRGNTDFPVRGDANPSLKTLKFYCSMWLNKPRTR